MTTDAQHQKRQIRIAAHLVCALATMYAATPEVVIDHLTGLLWLAGEAEQLKQAIKSARR